jgi:cytochrome c
LPDARQTGYQSSPRRINYLNPPSEPVVFDSFEMNKVLGAILGTCLGVVALNIAAGAVFAPGQLAKPGFDIEVPKGPPGQTPAPAEPDVPLGELLAKADIKRGEEASKKCAGCHTHDKGGKVLVGPPLWGVVGREKASVPGFNYSAAMKSQTGVWTIADLFKFIASPKAMVPGTAMTFNGIPRPQERADLMAYLNSLADNPPPLNKGAEAPARTRAAQASDTAVVQ